jgi:diaminobutyrate-2-oxoglutarate transaminase
MVTAITTVDAADVTAARESRVRSYSRMVPSVLRTAVGSRVIDTQGREYIDFLAGAGALNYGHNDPDMAEALADYLARGGIAHSLDLFTEAKERFLAAFVRHVLEPRGLDHHVQFTGPTGANAVEAGLKLARKVTGRGNVIAFTNAFHGVTAGALAATGNAHHRMGPQVALPGVTRMPYDGYLDGVDSADLLERVLDDPSSGVDPPAAILLETVQGEGGLNVASAAWLRRVAAIAREHGALLMVDDIQAGCGRTGAFFSFEDAGITPDLVALSKSLSGFGLPMAVLLIGSRYDQWRPGEHNGTFRGNNLAFVTARVAIEKFWCDRALVDDVARRSAMLRQRLTQLAAAVPGTRAKGRGMMVGLDVGTGELAGRVCRRALEQGLIMESSGAHDEVVKVLPPLTTPDDVLDLGLATLERVVIDEHAAESR